jgi:hypothetical protein
MRLVLRICAFTRRQSQLIKVRFIVHAGNRIGLTTSMRGNALEMPRVMVRLFVLQSRKQAVFTAYRLFFGAGWTRR